MYVYMLLVVNFVVVTIAYKQKAKYIHTYIYMSVNGIMLTNERISCGKRAFTTIFILFFLNFPSKKCKKQKEKKMREKWKKKRKTNTGKNSRKVENV